MRDEVFYPTQVEKFDQELLEIDQCLERSPYNFSLFARALLVKSQRRAVFHHWKKNFPESKTKELPPLPNIEECGKQPSRFQYAC